MHFFIYILCSLSIYITLQDDLARLCQDPLSAQLGIDCFVNLAKSKQLTYNLNKSYIIILGNKKARKKLKKSFEENPPKLYGKPMQIVDHQTYLGEELGFSASESITLTINKRIGLAKRAINDIITIVEDSRSKMSGSIKTGLLLWNTCVLPFLLNNSSTWLEMRKNDTSRLEKLQNFFFNRLLGVFKCPVPLMYWDLKALTIDNYILKEKLNLYFHLSCLPKTSLSYLILQIQKSLFLPSIH